MRPLTSQKNMEIRGTNSIKNFASSNTLANNFTSTQSNTNVASSNNNQSGNQNYDVWVMQWVDYSSKYGLGYVLSNGCSGVFFNDSTKIILDPTATYFEYMERRSTDK